MDDGILQPDPETIVVSLHPSHEHGDVVSVIFHDGPTGYPYRVVLDPDSAYWLAGLLASAVESPRVAAIADQMKAAQRDRA
ncbi:hypothetical protein PDG61_19235 [Mycolicibacterium sp. BiH015]|uniref:hypothetical protein n=1 Tax=Mycolicibacterium sp. BiH015 TaxID=3018808 RepID=UPI0022E108BF|nr:hypothetical protein [Mycolicibacterium sp. BiH015]MDA2893064.1 hypothetical protein [Mycolicibacterium sp. BiH015]